MTYNLFCLILQSSSTVQGEPLRKWDITGRRAAAAQRLGADVNPSFQMQKTHQT